MFSTLFIVAIGIFALWQVVLSSPKNKTIITEYFTKHQKLVKPLVIGGLVLILLAIAVTFYKNGNDKKDAQNLGFPTSSEMLTMKLLYSGNIENYADSAARTPILCFGANRNTLTDRAKYEKMCKDSQVAWIGKVINTDYPVRVEVYDINDGGTEMQFIKHIDIHEVDVKSRPEIGQWFIVHGIAGDLNFATPDLNEGVFSSIFATEEDAKNAVIALKKISTEHSKFAKTEIKNLKEIPVCNAREIGNFSITSADDINKLGNCAFEVKDETPVAINQPALIYRIQFTADMKYCYWTERKVTENNPYISKFVPVAEAKINKYIDTGGPYAEVLCSNSDDLAMRFTTTTANWLNSKAYGQWNYVDAEKIPAAPNKKTESAPDPVTPAPPTATAPDPATPAPPTATADTTPFAPSFDCSKATMGSERLICSDRELSKLDVDLSQSYSHAKDKSADKAKLKQQQMEWLKLSLRACSDKPCMVSSYQKRISELSN